MRNAELNKMLLNEVKIEGLHEAAKSIMSFASEIKIWVFEGQMGAGKTTLIKAICEECGVVDKVTSPTFSIVNEYMNEKEEFFYHFDFYRIEKEQEAEDIGSSEYFYSGALCLLEWPSKIPNLLPEQRVEIQLSIIDDNTRSINVIKYG